MPRRFRPDRLWLPGDPRPRDRLLRHRRIWQGAPNWAPGPGDLQCQVNQRLQAGPHLGLSHLQPLLLSAST